MDILTHTTSGLAVGTVMAAFSNRGWKNKSLLILAGGFAGALPDLDAISLWSKFDATLGKFFHLSYSGREIYSAKLWYSHHGFLHSITAALFIALLVAIVRFFIHSKFRNLSFQQFVLSIKHNQRLLLSIVFGFTLHLLEDMPTPAASWGGVNLFWPSTSYIGGTGDIWWWNNYDIYLIVAGVFLLNLFSLLLNSLFSIPIRKITSGLFILGFTSAVIQIKTRPVDFAYEGSTVRYQEFEQKSKDLQRKILGDKVFNCMERFDNSLSIYF